MTTRKKRGPYKVDASLPAVIKVNYRVNLDDKTVNTLRNLSAGNLSAGIRKAAAIIRRLEEDSEQKGAD